jgi:hypothetical protein
MLIGLGVVKSKEIVVFEKEGGRAGREGDLVHMHAGFEIIGDTVHEARVARNHVSSFYRSSCQEQTEPGLGEGGRAPFETEFPVFVNQLFKEGGGGG